MYHAQVFSESDALYCNFIQMLKVKKVDVTLDWNFKLVGEVHAD